MELGVVVATEKLLKVFLYKILRTSGLALKILISVKYFIVFT